MINRLLYWLPLFLVLSTSSPLWGGQDTGFMSYRRVICAEWPHMELPEPLADWEAYQRYRALLERTGALAKEGDFWWAIRPSRRFPHGGVAHLRRLSTAGGCAVYRWPVPSPVQGLAVDHYDATPVNREVRWITQENYWRAKRHGRHGQFIGVHDQAQVTAEGWLAQLLAQFRRTRWMPSVQRLRPSASCAKAPAPTASSIAWSRPEVAGAMCARPCMRWSIRCWQKAPSRALRTPLAGKPAKKTLDV